MMTLVLFLAAVCGVPGALSTPELLDALRGDDVDMRHALSARAQELGPEAIVPIAALLDSPRIETVQATKISLEAIVGRWSSVDSARAEAGKALCIANVAVKNRYWIFWLLSWAGGEEAVIPLLSILETASAPDFDGVLMALHGIAQREHAPERLSTGAVEKVVQGLLAELGKREGRERVAVIHVLGAVANAEAVPALESLIDDDDFVTNAVLQALADIGGEAARKAIEKQYERSDTAVARDAYLRVIESMPDREAEKAYQSLLKKSADPATQVAAVAGLGRTASDARSIKLLLEMLDGDRADVSGAATAALAGLPGEKVTDAIKKAVRRATPDMQEALHEILDQRDLEGSAAAAKTETEP